MSKYSILRLRALVEVASELATAIRKDTAFQDNMEAADDAIGYLHAAKLSARDIEPNDEPLVFSVGVLPSELRQVAKEIETLLADLTDEQVGQVYLHLPAIVHGA